MTHHARNLAAAAILTVALLTPGLLRASELTPERFMIHMDELNVVFSPDGKTLQVTDGARALSYGSDWEVAVLKDYLFHVRQKVWKGFYLKINSSRRMALKVTGGTFGQLGGTESPVKAGVSVIGGGNVKVTFGPAADPYLVVVPATKTMQIAAEGMVFSYCGDWQFAVVHPYLFHLKQNVWKGFYWKVNTSRKEIYLTTGTHFGVIGDASETTLPWRVTVVEAQAPKPVRPVRPVRPARRRPEVSAAVAGAVRPVGRPTARPASGDETTPARTFIHLPDMHLVITPGTNSVQVGTGDKVLSYGTDWETAKVKDYLYHLRLKSWQGFFWMVNTSRKTLVMVRGGTFGRIGGKQSALAADVAVIGGGNIRVLMTGSASPYVVIDHKAGKLQIIAHKTVMSYAGDWQLATVKPYLFHLRENFWKAFYWKLNTSRKEVYLVTDGTSFGSIGDASYETLPYKVETFAH